MSVAEESAITFLGASAVMKLYHEEPSCKVVERLAADLHTHL